MYDMYTNAWSLRNISAQQHNCISLSKHAWLQFFLICLFLKGNFYLILLPLHKENE